ncbi:hypothetical protein [Aquimarina sp. MMG016]|uniref:hypothetical protein n=1 Tax=Aquimarina sp. MMG016 TaxID=2822690 RepID=UPI001B39F626|nr:hypothetical protein [Aquimarina sp. MMG016]MBQ4821388.1 hypothetical protein [Aquimarina sp. MMG016]
MSESKKYKNYIQASSLIESVIAVTIIATCLLIAIRIYVSVLNSSSSINSYRIKFKLNQLVNDTKSSQNFDDELFEFKTYAIKKTVSDYEGDKDLKRIKFAVQTVSDTIHYNYLVSKKNNQ